MKVVFKITVLAAALAGCAGPAPTDGLTTVSDRPLDVPISGLSSELSARFRLGDATFDTVYLDGDGLGPNYVRSSCSACHTDAAKGPGGVQKMSLVEADGVTPLADQSALAYGHTVRPYYAGGATAGLLPPDGASGLKLTLRVGVAVIGRGYLEAIADSEIERVEAEEAARADGTQGRINRVVYASQPNPDTRYHQHTPGETNLIGRFGLKARIATLDDFAADAAQGDMSITSPLRPDELPNPGGLTDDHRAGLDVTAETINQLADYMRLLAIPPRDEALAKGRGPALFEAAQCSACHVPSLRTRADYPIAPLAGIDAPVFTDLLLHDLGPALADGLTDGTASSREWRTAPLIGLRYLTSYLHDGRAKTVEEAILAHGEDGSQARPSVQQYQALSDDDRKALLEYVSSL